MGKILLHLTEADIKASRAKLEAERPDLAEKFKSKKITGHQRNAFMREQIAQHLGVPKSKIKITKATMPEPTKKT